MKKFLIARAFIPSIAFAAPYAILDNSNVVTNIIEGDSNDPGFAQAFPNAVPLASPGGIGSTYNAGVFSAPPAPATSGDEWVSAEQFLMRFTQSERVAIEGSSDPGVVDFLQILRVTPNVNVKDPVTVQGVQYLEAKGLIASGRSVVILQ